MCWMVLLVLSFTHLLHKVGLIVQVPQEVSLDTVFPSFLHNVNSGGGGGECVCLDTWKTDWLDIKCLAHFFFEILWKAASPLSSWLCCSWGVKLLPEEIGSSKCYWKGILGTCTRKDLSCSSKIKGRMEEARSQQRE